MGSLKELQAHISIKLHKMSSFEYPDSKSCRAAMGVLQKIQAALRQLWLLSLSGHSRAQDFFASF